VKKKVPNIIKIEIPHDIGVFEKMHLKTIHDDIEKGYHVSKYDFDLYCAIRIKLFGAEKLSESFKNYCFNDGQLSDNIRFHKIRLQKQTTQYICAEDEDFYWSHLRNKVKERKQIIRDEIKRTGINANKLTFQNSSYLRTLIGIVSEFDDELTFIRWFVPIKLSFDKFVHIYVKHVEETKFAEGAFKKRTFFTYELEQVYTLLKVILRNEEEKIKDHFLEVAVANCLNDETNKKEYIDNWVKFNGDTFALAIDKNGYIIKFHQKN
jgi:hypothetical protein